MEFTRIPSTELPWENSADHANLAAAASVATSNGTGVIVTGITTVSTALTITAPIMVAKGGMITKSGSGTLVINGSFEAGLFKVFNGFSAGNVTFGDGSVSEIFPEWWGAIADGSTDSSAAFACSISAASVKKKLQEGTYLANFSITTSNVNVEGQSARSTYIKPYTDNPVITIDSTSGPIQYTTLKSVGLSNDGTAFANIGILIKGSNINDYIHAEDLFIWKFLNGIKVTGRTIWNNFENILVQTSSGNGIHYEINSDVDSVNLNKFTNVFSNGSTTGHGFYFKDSGTGATAAYLSNSFHAINAESNAGSGFRIDGLSGGFGGGGGIYDSYFESNTDIGFYASGTLLVGFDFCNNLCWNSTSGTDYKNTCTLSHGKYEGNRTSGIVHIEIGSGNISIGNNYGATYNIVENSNGYNFTGTNGFVTYSKGVLTSGTAYSVGTNYLRHSSNNADTVSSITDGTLGQILVIERFSGTGSLTFTHGTSANNINLVSQADFILPLGACITFIKTPTYWKEISNTSHLYSMFYY